ncbi:MAG: T9SS type A sorting domain-containing protein [Bacteroidales bacterium]|nr:T9SS type A sorting domain-containing protein [Bacteroidales bacterium]
MKFLSVTILFSAFLQLSSIAQPKTQFDWQELYKIDGDKCESVTAMEVTTNDDVVLTGIYQDEGGCRFEHAGGEKVYESNSGKFGTYSYSTLFLARYNSKGNLLWSVNGESSRGIHPWNLHCDKDGNSIVVGNFRDTAILHSTDGREIMLEGVITDHYSDYDKRPLNYFVAKYDVQGRLLWARTGRSNNHSVAFDAGSDKDGNIYVRGYCHSNSMGLESFMVMPANKTGWYVQNYSIVVVKYKPDGNEEWVTYGGGGTVNEFKVDQDGNCSLDMLDYDKILLFSSSGDQWKFTNAERKMRRTVITLGPDGKPVDSLHYAFGDSLMRIYKTLENDAGRKFGLVTAPLDIRKGNSYYGKWKDKVYETGEQDFFLASWDSLGNEDWIIQIEGRRNDEPMDMVFDLNGNIIISGWYSQHINIEDVYGDSIPLSSLMRGLFCAIFTPEGKLLHAENCGALPYESWAFEEYLNLDVDSKNRLYISGQTNMECSIAGREMNIDGEMREQRQWEIDNDVKIYKYSDAFFVSVKLKYDPETLLANADTIIETDSLLAISENTGTTNNEEPVFEKPQDFDILLFPNPVGVNEHEVNVQLEFEIGQQVQFIITDQNGKYLQQRSTLYEAGMHVEKFDMTGYAAGVYLMLIGFDDMVITKRIVVVE